VRNARTDQAKLARRGQYVTALFMQASERLKPNGCLYVMVSSDSDLDLFGRLIYEAGFRARLAYERSFYIESMILYELRAR
jgi:release factor glutamine methyltransferase